MRADIRDTRNLRNKSLLKRILQLWFGPCALVFCAVNLFAQLPSARCDLIGSPLSECTMLTSGEAPSRTSSPTQPESKTAAEGARAPNEDPGTPFVSTTTAAGPEGFHWGRALFESFVFLAIEQANVVHDDYRWVVSENGMPFNHYWRDYKQSLNTWVNARWDSALKIAHPGIKDGTWPCTKPPCVTGVGLVDLVMTPIGGYRMAARRGVARQRDCSPT